MLPTLEGKDSTGLASLKEDASRLIRVFAAQQKSLKVLAEGTFRDARASVVWLP